MQKNKKALVYCSIGLGDGLLFLMISNNLSNNGYNVDTFHPFLHELNNWFDYTKIKPLFLESEIFQILQNYDLIIFNSDYSALNKKFKEIAFSKFKDKTYELHPCTCRGREFLGSFKFDLKKSILLNFEDFLKKF